MENNLTYNKPFEIEYWAWSFNNTTYHIKKYRQIDCDEEGIEDYYYDFIILEFKYDKDILFYARKYNDENGMNFYFNQSFEKENLLQLLQKLKEKYNIKKTYYLYNNEYKELL